MSYILPFDDPEICSYERSGLPSYLAKPYSPRKEIDTLQDIIYIKSDENDYVGYEDDELDFDEDFEGSDNDVYYGNETPSF